MRVWNLAGASFAVFDGYQLTWATGFGMSGTAGGAAVSPTTLFRAASVSKPIAALIAFNRHGRSIDEDLCRLLPSRRGTSMWLKRFEVVHIGG